MFRPGVYNTGTEKQERTIMKPYEELKIDIIIFDSEDIIVTSDEKESTESSAFEMPFVPVEDL
jgi:hypothetical protein